jgi:hypothetical protein
VVPQICYDPVVFFLGQIEGLDGYVSAAVVGYEVVWVSFEADPVRSAVAVRISAS